jgi:ribose 5-phosphate isomerase B
MKVAIGADHAGFQLKETVKKLLKRMNIETVDFGTHSTESVDYPDIGAKVAESVSQNNADRGILICTTGIGMSIVANKFQGVRAALCDSVETAKLSRMHNDANVLALSGRFTPADLAGDIVKTFLSTPFEKGERHERRVNKIHKLTGM